MKYRLTIELGNDAMQTRADIAAALAVIAEDFEVFDSGEHPTAGDRAPIHDVNGNKVGAWKVSR